ncbi:MAG: adenosylcobinamide-GDP ribazoletransferase [Acidimicrobiia bacterium]|nr:adenosylcobinamide-GDP ribazoletransferase [Acidimicrobiia bacterium]
MKSFQAAMRFLTIFPGPLRPSENALSDSPYWFPVVGLFIGGIVALVDASFRLLQGLVRFGDLGWHEMDGAGLSLLLEGVVPLALLAVITGGLHLDGFMDCCDGLLRVEDRKTRLSTMRDPRVGAYAVIGVVVLLLAKGTALAALPIESRLWTIVLIPGLSRWAILLVMSRFPYVRESGIGRPFLSAGRARPLLIGSAIALPAALALTGGFGLILLGTAALTGWAVGRWSNRLIGGVTGDVYGATCEISETALFFVAALITLANPSLLSSPLLP